MAQYKAAWYPDPQAPKGSGVLRWYDGSRWTSYVHRPDERAAPGRPSAAGNPAPARPAPPHRTPPAHNASPVIGRSGATWDSIPQPGTTFRPDGLQRPRGRAGWWLVTLLALAVVVGLVLFTTSP